VGIVNHGANPNYDLVHTTLAMAGIPSEFLQAAEAESRWPGIRFDGRVLFTPEAGRINADASLRVIQAAARAHGAEIRDNTTVTRLDVLSGDLVRVTTDDEVFEAKRVIVTVGAWTAQLVNGIVPLPPLVVTDAQVAHFAVRDPLSVWPGFNHVPTPDVSSYGYWVSPVYGLLTPGEGVKVGWHGSGPVVDPDKRNLEPDPGQLDALARYAREWLPGVDPDQFDYVNCLSTSTPDSNFVLKSSGPVIVGAGCSGHAFKFTPVIGRILADLSDGTGPAPELLSSPWP
jgi:sarcosine oxidase